MQRIVLLVFILVLSGQAIAKNCFGCLQLAPYFGAEYQYQHIKADQTWGSILPTNFDNWALFVGNKFYKNLGLEFGYFSYLKTSKESNTVREFNGQTASAQTTITSSMRLRGYSLDAAAYIPLDYRFRAFVSVGVAAMRPTVSFVTQGGSDLAAALLTVSAKNQAVLRLGGGAEYTEKNWGARARVLWVNTQSIKLNVDNATPTFAAITANAFKYSVLVTVGAFFRF